MLRDAGVEFDYREYTEEPLDAAELRALFRKLDLTPAELLRRRDPAFRGLSEADLGSPDAVIRAMAEHPTLLQRPIAVSGQRAVVGRPAERVLELATG